MPKNDVSSENYKDDVIDIVAETTEKSDADDAPDDASEQRSFSQRAKQWILNNRKRASVYILFFCILVVLIWPYISVTLYPGQNGVFFSRLFGGVNMKRTYGEGIHFFLPWNKMYVFDTTIQQDAYKMTILMDGGLSVKLSLVCNHHLIKKSLPELLRTVGYDYKQRLLVPSVNTAVRAVLGNYDFEDSHWMLSRLQEEIKLVLIEQLDKYPLVIDELAVTNITLPTHLSAAITKKQMANQDFLAEKYRVMQAEQVFRRKYIEAEGVRVTQEVISSGLTESYLRWAGIQATKELALSNNTKILLMGGKDGLPVIFNADGEFRTSDGKGAKAAPAKENTPKPEKKVLTEEKTVSQTQKSLSERADMLLNTVKGHLSRMMKGGLDELVNMTP